MVRHRAPDLHQGRCRNGQQSDLNIWINQGEIPAALRPQLTDVDADRRITFDDLNDTANSAFVRDLNGNTYIDAENLLADPRWADGVDTDKNGSVELLAVLLLAAARSLLPLALYLATAKAMRPMLFEEPTTTIRPSPSIATPI